MRSAAIGIAIDWFMSRGYLTSIPLEQAPYDLVVESDEGLKRVQVKSTTKKAGSSWQAALSRRVYDSKTAMNASGLRRRVPYRPSEVDVFFIVTADRSVFIVPLAATGDKVQISLSKYLQYERGVAQPG